MDTYLTHLITFVVGTFTGASGNYFATKYTDKRKEKEEYKANLNKFKKIRDKMPQLINEMKCDLEKDETQLIREFVVLPSKDYSHHSPKPINRYYRNEHENLITKIEFIEASSFVTNTTSGDIPIYKMDEKFVEFVKKHIT